MRPYKFVTCDVPSLDEIKETSTYKLWNKLESGEALTRDEKNRVFGFGMKLCGWFFPFDGYVRAYVVKTRYYGWKEVLAYDKTAVRANVSGVIRIVEL